MRMWTLVIVVVVGIGAGIAQSWVSDFHPDHEKFVTVGKLSQPIEAAEARIKELVEKEEPIVGPRVQVVNGADYDFGSMQRGVSRQHSFLVKNVGTQPLELLLLRTTCKCTLSKIGKEILEPGEVTEITLEWSTKDIPRNQTTFNQVAEIQTNDATLPVLELRVTGEITEEFRIYPSELVARDVPGTVETPLKFRVFYFGDGDFELADWTFNPPKYAQFMDIQSEPLSDDDFQVVKGATAGRMMSLVLKPGLPLGPLLGTLGMEFTTQNQRRAVTLPVRINVISDIVLAGSSKFDRLRNTLNWGPVSSREGGKEILFAFVKGPHRNETKLSVKSIDPAESLQVKIDPAEPLAGSPTIRHKIELIVPPGAPRVDRSGANGTKLAHIVLSSTHPTTKEVHIYVRYAVR